MSNAVSIPKEFGQLATTFRDEVVEDELGAGIQSSFGIVGYRGKVWAIKYRGDEKPLLRDDGDGPRGSIEVVIVKSSSHISKIWYEAGWVEGSSAPPDCFSTNGVTPDPMAAKKQANACAACPKNAWGSRVTPAGKQGKACQDSKRVVVVPLGDLENEVYGGPMLLRIPAASLNDAAQYSGKLKHLGFPTFAVGTRIAFDPAESYPKFQFSAIRPLNESEAQFIAGLRNDPRVARILAEEVQASEAPVSEAASFFEQGLGNSASNAGNDNKPAPTTAPEPVVEPKKAREGVIALPDGRFFHPEVGYCDEFGEGVQSEEQKVEPRVEPKKAEPKKETKKKEAAPAQEAAPDPLPEETTSTGSADLDSQLDALLS